MFACSSGDLKAMEQRADDTGCSLGCIAHSVFGLEMGELLVCQDCQAVDEVQNSHLDFFMNLYASELMSLQQQD